MIQVTDVAKWYGTIRAVENVNFSLAPGEIVGFVGSGMQRGPVPTSSLLVDWS